MSVGVDDGTHVCWCLSFIDTFAPCFHVRMHTPSEDDRRRYLSGRIGYCCQCVQNCFASCARSRGVTPPGLRVEVDAQVCSRLARCSNGYSLHDLRKLVLMMASIVAVTTDTHTPFSTHTHSSPPALPRSPWHRRSTNSGLSRSRAVSSGHSTSSRRPRLDNCG